MAHEVDIDSPSSPSGSKRKRTTRACDRCHRNASRCSPGIEGVTCHRCEDQGNRCTYNRPVKRRGPRTRQSRDAEHEASESVVFSTAVAGDEPASTLVPIRASIASPTQTPAGQGDAVSTIISSQTTAAVLYAAVETMLTPDVIQSLVEVFYRSIYPIRPYFHWPTFSAQIRQQMYRSDLGLFATTMAICGLTAGRLYKGVPVSPSLTSIQSSSSSGYNMSTRCYEAAVRAMPADLSQTQPGDAFQAMKASALLASICLQNNELKKAVVHLGHYTTLSAMFGFHNEANWPSDLTEIGRQERRRLYWGVYQQEQYIATNFGVVARQREAQAAVLYPAEVFDDKDITVANIRLRPDTVSFVQGLNFCSDVYRLSENADVVLRTNSSSSKSASEPGGLVNLFLARVYNARHYLAESLHLVQKLHKELPDALRSIRTNTGDPYLDRFGIVSSNILLTTYNLKMRLVGTEKTSVHVCCAIASELLDEMGAVSAGFFQTASTSSLYHLAHVGHVLGSVIQAPISAWTYLQVRNILLVLADFLEKIEQGRIGAPNLALKLRAQISRIDQLTRHAQRDPESGLESMGQSLFGDSPSAQEAASLNMTSRPSQQQPVTTLFSRGDKTTSDLVADQSTFPSLTQMLGSAHSVPNELASTDTWPNGDHANSAFVVNQDQQNQQNQPVEPTAAPDILHASHMPLLPMDFFDGWPILSGETEATLAAMPLPKTGSLDLQLGWM